jgi:hypothetical protein
VYGDLNVVVKSPGSGHRKAGVKQFSPTCSVQSLRLRSTVGACLQVPIEPVYRRLASNPQGAKEHNAMVGGYRIGLRTADLFPGLFGVRWSAEHEGCCGTLERVYAVENSCIFCLPCMKTSHTVYHHKGRPCTIHTLTLRTSVLPFFLGSLLVQVVRYIRGGNIRGGGPPFRPHSAVNRLFQARPNAPDQRPRTTHPRCGTEAASRGPLHPEG